jgi:TM2 domain-containing membrane protein YozV
MNLRCTVLLISIGIFSPSLFFAQTPPFDTIQFVKHLKQNQLYIEQIEFNKILQKANTKKINVIDSLNLDLALTYYQLAKPDSCKKSLLSISNNCCNSDNLKKQQITLLFIHHEYATIEKIIDNVYFTDRSNNVFKNDSKLALKILRKTLTKSDTSFNSFSVSPTLFDIKNRYLLAPKNSPAIAGICSAVVPGLGKLYIGYKYQALSAFILNTLLGLQAAESYYKAGVKSPRFIITASLFSIFYTGNIIGSITMAKKKKRDYYNELDYETLNYYRSEIGKYIN